MSFKFLEHTADVKFQADGKNLEEAFENSALALKETIAPGVKIAGEEERVIEVSGKDKEKLLYEFLEEFLYLLDSEGFIFSRIKSIEIENNELNAVVLGDNIKNYNISNKVKAVTYNGMFVKKKGNKFICQVVLDV